MFIRSPRRLAAVAVVASGLLGGSGVIASAGTGPAQSAAVKRITASRVGAVHVGDRYQTLRARGLVGRIRTACSITHSKGAPLNPPLQGSVDLTDGTPRRVRDITISGAGAKARGVGVGSTAGAVRRAFPKARFDHSSESVFGITTVKVPRSEGGPWQLGVDTKTHRVTVIGVPFVAFCD
jgi:hypothetical protein